MCEQVVKTIASKFEFPAGYITLYDEENREVVNLGEIDFSGKFLPLGKRLPHFQILYRKGDGGRNEYQRSRTEQNEGSLMDMSSKRPGRKPCLPRP